MFTYAEHLSIQNRSNKSTRAQQALKRRTPHDNSSRSEAPSHNFNRLELEYASRPASAKCAKIWTLSRLEHNVLYSYIHKQRATHRFQQEVFETFGNDVTSVVQRQTRRNLTAEIVLSMQKECPAFAIFQCSSGNSSYLRRLLEPQ